MKMTLLCLLNTAMMATGQVMFKVGSQGKEIKGVLDILRLFFSPIIFLALCLYAVTTGLWIYILSQTPISYAYPIQALAFPLVITASMILFHEQISMAKWLGIAIIICGVVITTRS